MTPEGNHGSLTPGTSAPLAQPKLYVKPGVDLNGLAPGGARILSVLATAPLHLGFDITITCGKEAHGPADPHTRGDALDVRTRTLSAEQVVSLFHHAKAELGDLFTVLFECPVPERPQLDPRLTQILYIGKSSPSGQHLHLQVGRGKQFPSGTSSV